MQNKNNLKTSKGVISVYVSICLLTFIIILTSIYTIAVTVRTGQIKTLIAIKEVYEQDNNKIDTIITEITENSEN